MLPILFCQNWVICLFAQTIPITLIQLFLNLFWQEEWLALYRVVLTILQQCEPQILAQDNPVKIMQLLQNPQGAQSLMGTQSEAAKQANHTYWAKILDKVITEGNFSQTVTEESVVRAKRIL